MLPVIGDYLGFAIGIALSPMAIVGFILMLVSAGGLVKAWGFIGGWALGTAVVLVLVGLLVSNSADEDGSGTNTAVAWVKIVLGGVMIALAWHQFQGRPKEGEETVLPKWMSALDTFTPVKAFGMGAFLSAVNPKNLPLLIASSGVIGQAGLSGGEEVVVYVVFIILACLGMLIPIGIFLVAGDKGAAILDEVREWLVGNNAVIMAVLFLILGVSLLGKGLGGL
jgi:hypothetical protein